MDRDQELEQEVAAYNLANPPVKDKGQAHDFARLHGDKPVTEDNRGKAVDVCATNPRMFSMIRRAKPDGDVKTVDEFISRVHASPEYYRRLRAYYGMDFREGWLDRHLSETAPN